MNARLMLTAIFVATLSACASDRATPRADGALPASEAAVVKVLAQPDRSAADRERDAQRKPDKVLSFFGIREGMTVLDLYSGGGYYTEIVAGVVGPRGSVVAHNNTAYLNYAAEELAARFTPGRLPNVTRLTAENNRLALPRRHFDAVLLILAYHDIYLVDEENGWPRIDGPRMLAELFATLKPGGVLGVVDHVAVDGAPAETGGTLHRIDPQRLLAEISAAGFIFDGRLNALRNPDDDHTLPMYDPSIRGRTDRVVFRFLRPE